LTAGQQARHARACCGWIHAMHPLLNLIATRPQLLADHAQAYAELMADELPRAASAWKRQALLNALALLGLLAALVLAGVALMLWAALPALSMPAPWLLVVVPLLPLAAAGACLIAAQARARRRGRSELQQQLSADLAMLRQAAGP
jgi:protein-S-isoprenylcysteine O-methyltransferase Ste14